MTRTRLRQLEQIRNSLAYDDGLNMAVAEGQAGATIGTPSAAIASFTTSTIVVSGNYVTAGANKDDRITISGASGGQAANNGTHIITALSYSSGPNETTVTVSSTLVSGAGSGTATLTVDPNKNLRRDLDHIRTQLRKLNQTTNWYDDPVAAGTTRYELETGTNVSAGTDILLSNQFDAGEPYTLKVYLNGTLLLPSVVSSNAVVTSHDYVERDSTQPVGLGEVGDRVRFAFNIDDTDVLQFRWVKE